MDAYRELLRYLHPRAERHFAVPSSKLEYDFVALTDGWLLDRYQYYTTCDGWVRVFTSSLSVEIRVCNEGKPPPFESCSQFHGTLGFVATWTFYDHKRRPLNQLLLGYSDCGGGLLCASSSTRLTSCGRVILPLRHSYDLLFRDFSRIALPPQPFGYEAIAATYPFVPMSTFQQLYDLSYVVPEILCGPDEICVNSGYYMLRTNDPYPHDYTFFANQWRFITFPDERDETVMLGDYTTIPMGICIPIEPP